MNKVPSLGQVIYYRANKEIPVGIPTVVIASNTLYALYKTAKNKFLLITPKAQINVNGLTAQNLANDGQVVKIEMGESKTIKEKGILEQLLFEVESTIEPSETDPVMVPDISLDQKVDRYLVRYEREAIPTSAIYNVPLSPYESKNPYESKKSSKGLLEFLLFEQEPGENPVGNVDIGGGFGDFGNLGGEIPLTSGEENMASPKPKSPPIINTPKINLSSYCRSVARLIENYEALLDPKTTIFNRAKEYIRVNYDDATAKMFEEIMIEHFGINPQPPQRDQKMAPPAANAIYGGGSAGVG